MNKPLRLAGFATAWIAATAILSGCDWTKTDRSRFLNPSAVIKAPKRNLTNPIYATASAADEHQELPPGATLPTEEDLTYTVQEYVLSPNDMIQIDVLDLFAAGQEAPLRRQITADGYIDLPLVPDRIKAAGYTRDQLKEVVAQAFIRAQVLTTPQVSITILAQTQNTYNVLGAVNAPAPYTLIKPDLRLLDALSAARGISTTNITYIYVIRPAPVAKVEGPQQAAEKAAPADAGADVPLPELPAMQDETQTAPAVEPGQEGDTLVNPVEPLPAEEEGTATGPGADTMPRTDGDVATEPAGDTAPATDAASDSATESAPATEPSFSQMSARLPTARPIRRSAVPKAPQAALAGLARLRMGRSIMADEFGATTAAGGTTTTAAGTMPASKPSVKDPFGWHRAGGPGGGRVIAINVKQLQEGNELMNIVIRSNDTVWVPMLDRSFFYVVGEVSRPGPYDLIGQSLTLKQALAAAGGPGPLAWPSNSILIRRIGQNQEQMIPINLERIYHGDDPDMFLKPNDIIGVGTHAAAHAMAVMRNAFRATYGFGFVWDRNFADPLAADLVDSNRFKRF